MTEYQIENNSRRCAITGRELRPGEKYFSALLDKNGDFVRQDFSCEGWSGPPEGVFSFWTGHIPVGEEPRRPRIDDDLLLDCFLRLEGQPDTDKVNFRYVVALLLMRRKRLKFVATKTIEKQEYLCLECMRTHAEYQLLNPQLSEDQMEAVQEEVFKVLGWE